MQKLYKLIFLVYIISCFAKADADLDKLVQLVPGSKIRFEQVNLLQAENLYKLYCMDTQNIINQIK